MRFASLEEMNMVTPYNPETGEWTVFADPRPDKAGPYGKAVAHVPGTRPFSTPTQVLLWGDTKRAESYYPQAAQLLAQANRENVNDQPYFFKERKLGGDVRFKCRRDLYQDFIEIEAKPKPVPSGQLHLNFDSSLEELYKDGYHTDKNWGLPQYYYADGLYQVQPKLGSFGPSGKTALGIECTSDYSWKTASATILYSPRMYSKNKTIFHVFNSAINTELSCGFTSTDFSFHWPFGYLGIQVNHSASQGESGIEHRYDLITGSYSGSVNDMDGAIIATSFLYQSKKYELYPNNTTVDFSGVTKTYLNGSILSEDNWTIGTGEENNHYAYSWLYADNGEESTCSVATCQQMVVDALLSNDEVNRLTDELAKKWGF
jgi:hypothetical protein